MATFQYLLSQARRYCTTTPSSPVSLLLRPSSLGFHRYISSSSSLSNSENPNPDSNPIPSQTEPAKRPTIQAVSYAVKPKDPSSSQEHTPQPPPPPRKPRDSDKEANIANAETQSNWTREDIRYVKNVTPTVSPVSYPSRVGPLPPPPRKPRDSDREANIANAETQSNWTREDIRYVKNVTPTVSPVSYPSRVAPLPEDRAAAESEEDVKSKSGEFERERKRIETDNWVERKLGRVEEEKVAFPTLITVEKKKPKVVLELTEAIREVKANAQRNFNETVEAHVKLGIDRRRTDQQVSGTMTLPHGIGKVVKVAVFAEGAIADEARAAGADIVGGVELVEEIMNGSIKLDFDKCITTPLFMPRLGKIAKILGKRGLMPNPKRGTIVNDVSGAVKEAKHGLVDFKMDKTAIVHVGLGKVSFTEETLRENIGAFVNALLLAKPVGLKKTSKYAGYVDSFHLCSTMGPGFPVSIQSLSRAADHFNKLQLK